MNRSSHYSKIIPLVVLVSLVFAALTPSAVFAEGDIPEVPAAPPAAPPPAETETPAQAVQLLAESGAVILQDGSPLPLASQAALDVVCDPDPWYYGSGPACPGGVCSYYEATGLNQALNTWEENKGYGYIYIESRGPGNYYTLGHYPIDALGGFATLKGLLAVPGVNKPLINGSLTISNFAAGFTIQGLEIFPSTADTVLSFVNDKGTIKVVDTELSDSSSFGLAILDHSGAVELNRVSVHNNRYYGVAISNCGTGTTCAATGMVKITNSAIYNNGINNTTAGLLIESASPVLINGLTVHNNKYIGAYINGHNTVTIKNSSFTGTLCSPIGTYGAGLQIYSDAPKSILLENIFTSNNMGSGVWIDTLGNITIKRIQAINNGYIGIRIGSDVPELNAGGNTVVISDAQVSGSLAGNGNHRLLVVATGAVTLTNIVATGGLNGMGAKIDNTLALAAMPVTITNSVFNSNTDKGLSVTSNGVITLNSVTVMGNGSNEGAYLNNDKGFNKGITFLTTYGPNVIAENTNNGIIINTAGNLVMNNLQVYLNGRNGLTASPLTGSSAGVGGTILWNGGGAWNNGTGNPVNLGAGAILDNTVKGLTRSVTLRNVIFNDNKTSISTNPYYQGGTGLYIKTSGPVSITNISANDNAYSGVEIYTSSSVSILRNMPSGNNTFNNNGLVIIGSSGLEISAETNVVLNRVEAAGNSGAGARIQSDYGLVSVTGTTNLPAVFSLNKGFMVDEPTLEGMIAGLHISANGVRLTNIQTNQNYGAGTYIYSNGPVSFLGTLNEFSGNSTYTDGGDEQRYALFIEQAIGPVTVLNFKGEGNYGGGIYIDNTAGTGSVTLNTTVAGFTSSITKRNYTLTPDPVKYGLIINSRGAVTINRVDISDGAQKTRGGYINNTTALTSMPVKVSMSSFNNNYNVGLYIETAGAISLSKVTASGNENQGAYAFNDNLFQPGQVHMPVTVLNSVFNNNGWGGLRVASKRMITVSSVTANGNKVIDGIWLDNDEDAAASPILVTGKNQAIGNNGSGLYIESYGLVTVSGVEAGGSEQYNGIYIQTKKAVTLSNSIVYNNLDSSSAGIYIYTSETDAAANVTLSNVVSYGNASYGLEIDAQAGKVKLLNSSFIFNTGYGFYINVKEPPLAPSMTSLYFYMSNVNYFGNNLGAETYFIE